MGVRECVCTLRMVLSDKKSRCKYRCKYFKVFHCYRYYFGLLGTGLPTVGCVETLK